MMSFINLVEKLNGKKTGSGFSALCPAHDDKNPSLSLNEINGKILFHCHAGCTQENVLEKLKEMGWTGVSDRKEKNENKERDLENRANAYFKNLSKEMKDFLINERMVSEEAINVYKLGQKGNSITIPISLNDRIEDIRLYLPIKFRKKNEGKVRADLNTNAKPKIYPEELLAKIEGKLVGGLDKHENLDVLDNLSVLNTNQFILVCEGELDALAAISAGFNSVTNTCGANTWEDYFSEQIAALKMPVIIVMDNDSAGDLGAHKRAESLKSFGAKIYIAQWPPERPVGHDITDELKSFGKESLISILKKSEPYSDIIYMNEVVAQDISWLFRPLIALGKTTIIEGEPGIGKSFLTLSVAATTSTGGQNPLDTEQNFPLGKVLLMSAEDGLADTIKPRLDKMNADLCKIFAPKEIFTLDEKGFLLLEKLVETEKPILVIIDPLMPFLAAKADSNKASDMRPFFKSLARIAQKFNCAIVITRHLSKNTDQNGVSRGLGSIDIAAAVRSILQVSNDMDNKEIKIVTHVKCNIGVKARPFGYKLNDGVFSIVGYLEDKVSDADEPQGEMDRACEFLKDALKDGPLNALEVKNAAKDMGISKSTLDRAKKKLSVRSKRITEAGSTNLWQWYLGEFQYSQDGQHTQATQDKGFKDYYDPESYKE